MIKSKKQMFIVISVFALVMLLGTVTYAFFNYTRTGTANTIRVGRISFVSKNEQTINLTNLFPIDPTETGIMDDATKVGTLEIEIEGDTDYADGVEYLISAVDSSITTNGKVLPISLDITVTTLGTESSSYWTARESKNATIYKKLVGETLEGNQMLLVGYIKPNTTSGTAEGVDGSITIKAYLDENKILISDTYNNGETPTDNLGTPVSLGEGKTVFTTTEWNALQSAGVSFQVKVEANQGIWVENPNALVKVITRKASTASYISSYGDIITSNPTFATQDTVGTNANKQTVYYYTGNDAVANSNVLFAGYCWQIIRTTDNGGVKLIYNGVAQNDKCESTRNVTKGINGSNGTSTSLTSATLYGRSYDYDLTTGQFTIEDSIGLPTAWSESDTNNNGIKDYEELIGTYTCKDSSATCTTLYYVGSYKSATEAYVASYTIGNVDHYSQLGSSTYNPDSVSPAFVGYMFNKVYDDISEEKSGEYYGTAVWNGSTYVLSDGNGGTAPDATHHYICDSDCTKVRYYSYRGAYYFLLENGKTVEDALKEMINYKANASDEDENINVYNSAIKGYLDNWYKKNLTAYASYLDNEAVFCNERSVSSLGGWNSNGTNLDGDLQFKHYNSDSDLNCVNVTDRLSKGNNKAKLEYPIGLLTEPERVLMTATFAKFGSGYWIASPTYFNHAHAYARIIIPAGASINVDVYFSGGVRGVVTLKPSANLEKGSGTYLDPYVIGPIVQRSE